MTFIYSFSKKINFNKTILEYHFNSSGVELLKNLIPFEREDSEFAPEPSVACGLRAENGNEFGMIFLQMSKRLLVFAEDIGCDETAIETFRRCFPTLSSMEVPAAFDITEIQ